MTNQNLQSKFCGSLHSQMATAAAVLNSIAWWCANGLQRDYNLTTWFFRLLWRVQVD